MIVSFNPGRVRIRHSELKDETKLAQLADKMSKLPGAGEIYTSPRTGSLLYYYDPEVETSKTAGELAGRIKKKVASAAPYLNTPEKQGRVEKKLFNRCMALALGVCTITPLVGMMKLHQYSGLFFLGSSIKHMFDYRHKIF